MNCNFKTMLKLAGVLGVVLATVYFALPAAQAFVLASAPLLLALICPLSMLVAMFMMKDKVGEKKASETAGPSAVAPPTVIHDVFAEKV